MFPPSIQNLIDQFSKLPGIGPKAAERLVFYLLNQPNQERELLASAIKELKEKINVCPVCFNLAEDTLCSICQDPKRDRNKICVVENVLDIIPLEKTGQYNGLYHILGGVLSPTDGIGPEKLHISQLIQRVKTIQQKNQTNKIEIIIATNPTTEGDTTALYLLRILKPLNIKITRLARGLPTGADLEYADEATLGSALAGRREYQ